MGRKLGAVTLWGELGPHLTQCGHGRGLHLYQVAFWSIEPFGHNRHVPKIGVGLCPFGEGELGPHLRQCGLARCLPPCQVASWSIQPFRHNRHDPKIGRCAPLGEGELPSQHVTPAHRRASAGWHNGTIMFSQYRVSAEMEDGPVVGHSCWASNGNPACCHHQLKCRAGLFYRFNLVILPS